MSLNMIPGLCTEDRWRSSRAGIHIRGSSWRDRESLLDWDSASDYSAASAGVLAIGDTIGMAAGESSLITTLSSRIAGPSSIAMIFVRVGRILIMAPIFT